MERPVHLPVLTRPLLDLLALAPGARCIDATIDGGGHTTAILQRIHLVFGPRWAKPKP